MLFLKTFKYVKFTVDGSAFQTFIMFQTKVISNGDFFALCTTANLVVVLTHALTHVL